MDSDPFLSLVSKELARLAAHIKTFMISDIGPQSTQNKLKNVRMSAHTMNALWLASFFISVRLWGWEIRMHLFQAVAYGYVYHNLETRGVIFSGRKKLIIRIWLFSPRVMMLSLRHLYSGNIT